MKKITVLLTALSLLTISAKADASLKWYGFIRNYFAYDTRECWAGTADMFSYLPKDVLKDENREDYNATSHFSYTAITSRLGVDLVGYEFEGWKMGAKIEADFYSGLTGVTGTATFRMRQAYLTLAKNAFYMKMGQAWHPMAADMPDVFALNTGAPFGPFSRTPLAQFEYKLSDAFSLTGAAIWQMQYQSAGPDGASANYMKYAKVPEFYFGVNFKQDGFTARLGADYLYIRPRIIESYLHDNVLYTRRVDESKQSVLGFAYLSYTKDLFTIKAKTVYGQGGEHLSMNSGYAATLKSLSESERSYTPYTHSSSWLSLKYGKKLQGVLFAGYFKNFGTKETVDPNAVYFYKNSSAKIAQAYRITPAVIYNFGKLAVGLEYELTSAQYGTRAINNPKLYTDNLHWVTNNRVQLMVKLTF